MDAVHNAERLKELQSLPLDRKIQISQARIIEWYQRWNGNVVVSFSGGKDSTVLLHLVRSIYPDVPAVFSNTGLEYPEIQRFVRTFPNVEIVAPKMRFDQVISTYGYPLIGKEVAEAIYYARRLRSQSVHVERENKPLPCGVSAENFSASELAGGWKPSTREKTLQDTGIAHGGEAERVSRSQTSRGDFDQRTTDWHDWRGGVFSPESKEQFGEKSIFNKEKWLPLTYIPVPISHYCCQVTKKSPLRAYQRKTKSVPFLGTLAEESRIRQQAWIRHWCNVFDSKKPTSQPLSFWTGQDILQYLVEYGEDIVKLRRDFFFEFNRLSIDQPDMLLVNGRTVNEELEINYSSPIAAVYGDIVATDDDGNEYAPNPMMCAGCKLKTTGADRTGCIYCCFGCHLEKGETRFQRLARTHPRQYEYALGGGQWVDNPAYDPTAPEYDGKWKNWNPKQIWVPSKKGIGLKTVFDMVNEIYGKDFYRYE